MIKKTKLLYKQEVIIIAYGKKSREETTREAISSPNDIDLDYDIAIKQVNQKIEKKYKL